MKRKKGAVLAGLAIVLLLAMVGPKLYDSANFYKKPIKLGNEFFSDNSDPRSSTTPTELIVKGAREQLEHPAKYSGKYYTIPYPYGDIPKDQGACVDVVIRAYRNAAIDLQRLIHEDMLASPYPGLTKLDTNIDHRRCPNLMRYFSRHALAITAKNGEPEVFEPGDVVFWKLPMGKDHVGIVSNRLAENMNPLIIHNVGPTVCEADVLFDWKMVGHFRYLKTE